MRTTVNTVAAVLVAFILAACGSSGEGESGSESNSGPGTPANPTPATQSKEGVEAAERALVKAYETKRWYNAYQLQSKRCRKATDFDTYQGQILMAFGMLPEDLDWTIESVTVHSISEDKKVAKAEVVIPDLNAAMGPSSTEGDRWVYEAKDGKIAAGWKLDDCEGGESKSASEGTQRNINPTSEADVIKHIRESGEAITAPDDLDYSGDYYCSWFVILTSPDEITTYAGAGDPVATDPNGMVGVKIDSNDEAQCADSFEKALSTWK